MQRQHGGNAGADVDQRAQIEVATLQVVAVHDVRTIIEPLEAACRGGKIKILESAAPRGPRPRMGRQPERSAEQAEAAMRKPTGQPPQTRLRNGVTGGPERQ